MLERFGKSADLVEEGTRAVRRRRIAGVGEGRQQTVFAALSEMPPEERRQPRQFAPNSFRCGIDIAWGSLSDNGGLGWVGGA